MNARKFLSPWKMLVAAAAIAASTSPAQAGLSIGVLAEDSSSNGAIFTVNITRTPNTASATAVTTFGGFTTSQGTPNALGASGTKYFFTTGATGTNQAVYSFDLATGGTPSRLLVTGNATIGTTTTRSVVAPGGISGADAVGGTFYGFRSGNSSNNSGIQQVNGILGSPTANTSDFIGATFGGSNLGVVTLGDLAIDTRDNNQGYLAYSSGGSNYLARINLGTGLVTNRVNTGTTLLNGLAFDQSGNLYATIRGSNFSDLIALDKSFTGASTFASIRQFQVRINGMNGFLVTDASAAAVPEPVSILAGLIGLPCVGGVVGFARRKMTKAQA